MEQLLTVKSNVVQFTILINPRKKILHFCCCSTDTGVYILKKPSAEDEVQVNPSSYKPLFQGTAVLE